MKQEKKYFKASPNLFMLKLVGGIMGVSLITSFATLEFENILAGVFMFGILFTIAGFDPVITAYKDRMELKYLGIQSFWSKTIYFETVKNAHVEYVYQNYGRYLCTFNLKSGNKTIKLKLKEEEQVVILLHLLSNNGIHVYKSKNDEVVAPIFQLVKKQRKSKKFKC